MSHALSETGEFLKKPSHFRQQFFFDFGEQFIDTLV